MFGKNRETLSTVSNMTQVQNQLIYLPALLMHPNNYASTYFFRNRRLPLNPIQSCQRPQCTPGENIEVLRRVDVVKTVPPCMPISCCQMNLGYGASFEEHTLTSRLSTSETVKIRCSRNPQSGTLLWQKKKLIYRQITLECR